MIIAGRYSFKGGEAFVTKKFPKQLAEVEAAIRSVNAESCRTKVSKEKTMEGKMLFHPPSLNACFSAHLKPLKWSNMRVDCEYSDKHYSSDYKHRIASDGAFRDMDFVKDWEPNGNNENTGYRWLDYDEASKILTLPAEKRDDWTASLLTDMLMTDGILPRLFVMP